MGFFRVALGAPKPFPDRKSAFWRVIVLSNQVLSNQRSNRLAATRNLGKRMPLSTSQAVDGSQRQVPK
jgi:hypothetical protein